MAEMRNVEIFSDGTVRPRRGYKTFRGFVYQMWLINKRYKKLGVSGTFTVTLPLPEKLPITSSYMGDLTYFDGTKKRATK